MQQKSLLGLLLLMAANGFFLLISLPTAEANMISAYGASGTITESEALTLYHLAFPQSYRAIINRLGYPYQRSEAFDVYRLENRPQRIIIRYQGTTAIGWQVAR